MKRSSPPSRRTPLARTPFAVDGVPGKQRRAPLPRQGDPARAAAREEAQYGPHAEWIREQRCAATGRFGTAADPVVAAHAWHTRGAGGRAEDCLPLLLSLERRLHGLGRETFQAAYGIDLEGTAAHFAAHSPALRPTLAARVARLPCAGETCTTPGPHPALLAADGSFTALCRRCRAEAGERRDSG